MKIVRKAQSETQENYSEFVLQGPRGAEIKITLCDGIAIRCSKHRRAASDELCECMQVANAEPDKDQYWKEPPFVDFSDLFED